MTYTQTDLPGIPPSRNRRRNYWDRGIWAALLVALLVALPLLALLSGCETTARQAGQDAGLVAVIAYDTPEDAEILAKAKRRIDAYLATGQPITDQVVNLFADWLAAELGRNPAAIRLAVSRLQRWADPPGEKIAPGQISSPGQPDPVREFVAGVSDSLGIAFEQ